MSKTESGPAASNIKWHNATVTRDRREAKSRHRSILIWFTGLSGAGKSTIAHAVEEILHERGCRTYAFDGDNVRHGLCRDLGFSAEDRSENIRRIGEMARLFLEAGVISLAAFISPYRKDRAFVQQLVGAQDYIEIYCRCSLEKCEERDVKGLYKRARAGEIKEFTGISAPYEEPEKADLVLTTDTLSVAECAEQVIALLATRGIINERRSR